MSHQFKSFLFVKYMFNRISILLKCLRFKRSCKLKVCFSYLSLLKGNDLDNMQSGLGQISVPFSCLQDTQFLHILHESLDFFNIPPEEQSSYFLIDTKTSKGLRFIFFVSQIAYLTHCVINFRFVVNHLTVSYFDSSSLLEISVSLCCFSFCFTHSFCFIFLQLRCTMLTATSETSTFSGETSIHN